MKIKIQDRINDEVGGLAYPMVYIEGGRFELGSMEYKKAQPIREIEVPSFYLGKYPVTQALYAKLMNGDHPSYHSGANRPVEQVSWEDAQVFITQLNKLTGQVFRLPSEAEWEYAARGGQLSEGYTYSGSDDLNQVGWYNENSGYETKPVGLLQPNELGLYDMSGNVWEWCEDGYHSDYKDIPLDGSAWLDQSDRGSNRVIRGGGCLYGPIDCRPSYRFNYWPVDRLRAIGFRLALSSS